MLAEDRDRSSDSPVERRQGTPGPVFNIATSGLRWPILLLRQGLLLLVDGIDARYGLRDSAAPQSSLHVEIKLSSREQLNRSGPTNGQAGQNSGFDADPGAR
jgi:hypothetical protein